MSKKNDEKYEGWIPAIGRFIAIVIVIAIVIAVLAATADSLIHKRY